MPVRPRFRKQLLLKLGVFLLLGVVVNVAVAWIVQIAQPETTSVKISIPTDQADALWKKYFAEESDKFIHAERYYGPAHHVDVIGIGYETRILFVTARGWPFLALASASKSDRHGDITDYDLWELTPQMIAVPTRPIWPGFAINTIFYAALLWMLFYGPGKIRRLLRIRRGCCSACGYKIAPGGGIGPRCSECGDLLTRQAFAESASNEG